MIGRLHGRLAEKKPPFLLIDVNGVGYEVAVSMQTLYQLPALEQSITLHIQTIIREDAHALYGFACAEERELFRLLIKANGVGPKLALTVLSNLSVDEFVSVVQEQQVSELLKVPGIGKKTAERLLIELRDKIQAWPGKTQSASQAKVDRSASDDAVSALIALGYKPTQARDVVKQCADKASDPESLIRIALQTLASHA